MGCAERSTQRATMDGDKTEKVFLLLKQQFSWLASQQAVGSCINRATDLKEHPDAILGKGAAGGARRRVWRDACQRMNNRSCSRSAPIATALPRSPRPRRREQITFASCNTQPQQQTSSPQSKQHVRVKYHGYMVGQLFTLRRE